MVATFDDYARLCRNDVHCPQREIIHPGIRDREHGWPSPRRVLAHTHVQKTWGTHREGRGEVMKNKRSSGALERWSAAKQKSTVPLLNHSITPSIHLRLWKFKR